MQRVHYLLKILIVISIFTQTSIARSKFKPAKISDPKDLNPKKWEKIFDEKWITIYSQEVPKSDYLAFKAVTELKAPIDQVMEVLRQVENNVKWAPGLTEKYTLREISANEAYTYSVNEMPWPLNDRELVLHNKLYYDKKRNGLICDSYSVRSKDRPVAKKKVRAMMNGYMFIRYGKDKKHTYMEFSIIATPGGNIPQWLANWVQKDIPYDFLKSLEKRARKTKHKLRPSFKELLALIPSPKVTSATAAR